jgi:hypothetical protein
MNIKRFTQIIEAYGADSNRWPESERQAALALLTTSTEAQQLTEQEDVLDSFLNTVAVNSPSLQLQQNIFNAIAQSAKSSDDAWQELIDWLFGRTWQQHLLRPALTFLLPLILGVFLGVQLTTAEETPLTQEALWQTEMNLVAFDTSVGW